MSIINNANPGSSILILSTIDQYLRNYQSKRITLDVLKQHLRPDTLAKNENAIAKYKENLNFWLKYNIWQVEDEQIFIRDGDEKISLEYRVLKNIIENTTNKDNFFDGNNVEPFLLYITCLIDQDRYSFAGGDRLITGSASNISQAVHHQKRQHFQKNLHLRFQKINNSDPNFLVNHSKVALCLHLACPFYLQK